MLSLIAKLIAGRNSLDIQYDICTFIVYYIGR